MGGDQHVLVRNEDAFVGLSRFTNVTEVGPWVVPAHETIVILEGAVRIEIAGGPTLELGVGDMATLPKGATTTWHLTLPFKEIWFFARAYDETPRA